MYLPREKNKESMSPARKRTEEKGKQSLCGRHSLTAFWFRQKLEAKMNDRPNSKGTVVWCPCAEFLSRLSVVIPVMPPRTFPGSRHIMSSKHKKGGDNRPQKR